LRSRQHRHLGGLCLGFLPVLGMALHNFVYGGRFVLFTASATHPGALVMPPSAWLSALGEVVRFDFVGPKLAGAIAQIGGWLAGPSESVVMVPLDAAAVAVLVRVAVAAWADPWLRLTAGATLAQHGVALFYATPGR